MRTRFLAVKLAGMFVLALGACSGGGGGGSSSVTPPAPVSPPTPSGLVSSASAFAVNCAGVPNPGTLYTNAEVEPHLAINPANPNNLIGSWQQDRWSNGASQGNAVGVSFDAGATWSTRPLPASRCGGGNAANSGDYERASDPWVTISPNGTAYQMSLAVSGATLEPGSQSAMLVFRSVDGGRNWSNAVTLIRDGDQFFNDKNSITADPTDSRFVYAVWDRLTQDNRGPAFFARTTDGGVTWETARAIHDPGINNQTLGSIIVVLPDGTLINFFNQLITVNNALVGSFQVMRSSDKGATWSAPIKVADFFGIGTRDPETGAAIRDAGYLGQISVGPQGQLYAVWQDARFSNGVRDAIALSRSIDGGLTWSGPQRVNADPSVQAMIGTVNARADGIIGVGYADMRNNTSDTNTLLVDHWLATTRDTAAWIDRRVTTASFDLALAPVARGYFLGDYMGLVSSGTTFFPFYVRTNNDLANRNDVYITPMAVPMASAESSINLRLADEPRAFSPTEEHRQRVHANIVRAMEQRAPGWASRRGWRADTP
ncbi:MAG: exo-alpha-sialidase [Betaproteobacteria bacterium]|nr:exo-alpha-sialidase [Betaproteobacteria bacterium]